MSFNNKVVVAPELSKNDVCNKCGRKMWDFLSPLESCPGYSTCIDCQEEYSEIRDLSPNSDDEWDIVLSPNLDAKCSLEKSEKIPTMNHAQECKWRFVHASECAIDSKFLFCGKCDFCRREGLDKNKECDDDFQCLTIFQLAELLLNVSLSKASSALSSDSS
jgi:hypothetical protein